MKYLITNILILIAWGIQGQPPLNERFNFDKYYHVSGSIEVNDSCYYLSGSTSYDSTLQSDLVFTKMDFDGNILEQSFVHHDSLDLTVFGTNNLTPTLDGNFVAVTNAYPYKMLIKYAPNGDTLFTHILDTIYDDLGDVPAWGTGIVCNSDGVSYTLIFSVYD
ncbi:hypothetical protein JYT72_03300, partial [Crocinitomix catalasitica]|nr:hypothetical protein [Crocinitomix catalasitica]